MDDEGAAGSIVFVVDDDPEMRAAIKLMLSTAGLQVTTFTNAEEFLQHPILPDVPKCLLLDLRMRGLSGLGLQQRLSNEGPNLPVIFLTGFGDVPTAVQAIRSGAVDFLEKPLHRDTLLERVKRALDLDAHFLMIRRRAADFQKRLASLSRRERDVCQLLLKGMSNKEIAATLGIGIPTATKHRSRLLVKLHVRNVFELISAVARYHADYPGHDLDLRPNSMSILTQRSDMHK